MRKRKRKKGYVMGPLDFFVKESREKGLTYAQAQVKETCELIRRQEMKRKLQETEGKKQF